MSAAERARADAASRILLSPVSLSRKGRVAGGRWRSYLPILQWLPPYVAEWRENLRFDLMAALTITCLAVPQSMAYALLAGVPPIYGCVCEGGLACGGRPLMWVRARGGQTTGPRPRG